MIPPLRGVFEGLAPSVSFFGSKEECQPENAFEAANGYIRYENNYSNNDFLFFFLCVSGGRGERESTSFTLLWVIRNLSASERMTSS